LTGPREVQPRHRILPAVLGADFSGRIPEIADDGRAVGDL
jgi:hypothetical protein